MGARTRATRAVLPTAALAITVVLAACTATDPPEDPDETVVATPSPQEGEDATSSPATGDPDGSGDRRAQVTIALAGDVHFEAGAAALARPGGGLGPVARTLRRADLAMVNLETPVSNRGSRDPKELERPGNRYHFRAPPGALETLADAGVDVVSLANNHAGDYGRAGLVDTLAAGRRAGVAVVGAGRDQDAAFAPHVATVGDVEVALIGADTVFREGSSDVWAAGPDHAGVAAARGPRPAALLAAVSEAAASHDLVVVYLHWGREHAACPGQAQRLLVRDLDAAGADVVVGAHSHHVGGAGWAGETYVSYGLGNFVWYHDRQPDTGVLTLALDADGVISDRWTPARISDSGRPLPVTGDARRKAVDRWREGGACAGLGGAPGQAQTPDPAYSSSVEPIGADLAARMRGTSHRPGCPVPLRDLRHLEMTFRDFSGRARTGEMVVHRRYAEQVTEVFGRLYDAGWPIARMRLIDEYDGDDDASMAANNTSGFNCRRVAGQQNWSDHAFGAAIDLNPRQNPYVRNGSVSPPSGRRFAGIDRGRTAPVATGVVREGDLPVTAFAAIGWEWGGYWVSSKDWQHVAASRLP